MNLQELEARLQQLIEVQLISVLPGQKAEDIIIHELTSVMRSNAIAGKDGKWIAPNEFTLLVHPDSVGRWQKPQLLDTLTEVLKITGEEEQFQFNSAPTINIVEDSDIPSGGFNLIASHKAELMEETKDMKSDTDGESAETESAAAMPENAFLIVEGVKVFQLKQPVVNIGRRLDNSLVVDDPRVSRNHAQIRAIKGRFVLFDLNSSGGTFVNGQRATQSVLYPGDVISLAGVSLIFGQDNAVPGRDLSNTSPNISAGAERSTAIIRTMPPMPKKKK